MKAKEKPFQNERVFLYLHFRSVFKSHQNAYPAGLYPDPSLRAYKGTAFGNYRNVLKRNFKLFTFLKNKQHDDYSFIVSRAVLLLAL
ncbi:MAG: hypothetical protein Q8939_19235, partial [Bacteroidota bacterium]|nr:hypothetical protein [Bacteroidota bacterium]